MTLTMQQKKAMRVLRTYKATEESKAILVDRRTSMGDGGTVSLKAAGDLKALGLVDIIDGPRVCNNVVRAAWLTAEGAAWRE